MNSTVGDTYRPQNAASYAYLQVKFPSGSHDQVIVSGVPWESCTVDSMAHKEWYSPSIWPERSDPTSEIHEPSDNAWSTVRAARIAGLMVAKMFGAMSCTRFPSNHLSSQNKVEHPSPIKEWEAAAQSNLDASGTSI